MDADLEGLLCELDTANKFSRPQQKSLIQRRSQNFIHSMNAIATETPLNNFKNEQDDDYSDLDGDMQDLDSLLEDLKMARKELATEGYLKNKKPLNKSEDVSVSVSMSPSSSSASPNSTATDATESNKVLASRQLEKLMNSLSMYKTPEAGAKVKTVGKKDSNVLKNVCRGCEGPINGQVITAMGSIWHPEHFLCSHCHKSIGTQIFYEKDEQPYCETDYLQLFSPKCAACTQPILDKMLTALNASWHLRCFKCKSCTRPLHDESFLEINSSAYCKDCYQTDLAPKCTVCSQAIVDNFISALDAYFHPTCFVCAECGVPFNATSFYEHNRLPYCELHYHMKRGSLCHSCARPINGRCVTAMAKKYHPEHFNCSFCLQQLSAGTFKEQNDKPYCHSCFFKLFPN